MENIRKRIEQIIKDQSLIYCVLSNARKKDIENYNKVTIRPILVKGEYIYQFTYNYPKKVTHENIKEDAMINKTVTLFEEQFKQGQIYTKDADVQILISKKLKVKILEKPPTKKSINLEHNRKKNHMIPENEVNPFLIRLGVMNEDGKVLAQKYDKFRQINRFLEMVADVVPHLEKKTEKINIIDFGCGKSYLTFALYHYFVDILKLHVNIIGLDLKKDVVNHCNEISKDLGYEDLKFMIGDIEHFTGADKVDMVVTLHACDMATDAAFVKAIEWDADIILSVPCCQHELFDQIHNSLMNPMEKHGIIKERMSALITDSIRANILEIMGYTTQILEFIDLEHTPKNLLIRAIKTNKKNQEVVEEYRKFKEFWGVNPYFENALGEKLKKRLL
ncbi:class I SAM-dependent methyltransferase [Marinisporobacter balticus]|uniref:Methyltransferase family protein n=1 Tax=Marinisporobacter balticus TaxID=2018667 RepID=A0A4V6NPC9_9FIRM|nr:SAM-dependent methyltransferase [Marinisporobacter balticus]TCO74420.1 methyltransferase family protein [Marinisporobacter balticus]